MTVEWFDLGQRLAASQLGTVVPRLAHSAVWWGERAVAVRAGVRGGQVMVTACAAGGSPETRKGEDGLRLLGDLGVLISGDRHTTLLTDTPGTLPALVRLASATRTDGRLADVGAHVGWWAERADFPGTSAVIDVIEACRVRWVTGTAPDAERHPATWRTWLDLSDDSTAGLFDLAAALREGTVLPMLDSIAADDARAWEAACRSHSEGWDWRVPDSMSRAAAGLRSRCDAADLWASALLEDPVYRRRAVHTGHVVHGRAVAAAKSRNRVRVVCDRMDARLRTDATVVGWTNGSTVRFSGTVSATGVERGRLVLDLLVTAATRPANGATVTLMPAPHSPDNARRRAWQFWSLYSKRSSWLTTGRTPTPQRREVPLEVLLAGASDED